MERKQVNKFHDVDVPENVFKSYKSENVQGVVNTLCHKMGIYNPPHVNMFNDPGHVYTSYFECTKTLNVSKAAVTHLPRYAWIGMLAHEIGHHYALENDLSFDSKLEEMEFADRIASELTSPASVILAIKYFLKYYDPVKAPNDIETDKARINKIMPTKNAEHSAVNALGNLLSGKTNSNTASSATTNTIINKKKATPLQQAKEAIDNAIDTNTKPADKKTTKSKDNQGHKDLEKELMNSIGDYLDKQSNNQNASTPKKQPKPVNTKPKKKSKPKIKRNLN